MQLTAKLIALRIRCSNDTPTKQLMCGIQSTFPMFRSCQTRLPQLKAPQPSFWFAVAVDGLSKLVKEGTALGACWEGDPLHAALQARIAAGRAWQQRAAAALTALKVGASQPPPQLRGHWELS